MQTHGSSSWRGESVIGTRGLKECAEKWREPVALWFSTKTTWRFQVFWSGIFFQICPDWAIPRAVIWKSEFLWEIKDHSGLWKFFAQLCCLDSFPFSSSGLSIDYVLWTIHFLKLIASFIGSFGHNVQSKKVEKTLNSFFLYMLCFESLASNHFIDIYEISHFSFVGSLRGLERFHHFLLTNHQREDEPVCCGEWRAQVNGKIWRPFRAL